MEISENGINFIKEQEGLAKKVKILGKEYIKAYRCPAGVLTIGYGSTSNVREGDIITKEHAIELLKSDLSHFVDGVNKLVKAKIKQNEFDMIVSLAFNIGLGNLKSSTFLKKLNAGEKMENLRENYVCWRKAGGKILPVLELRRKKEWAVIINGYNNI